jgi:hypothetical protein
MTGIVEIKPHRLLPCTTSGRLKCVATLNVGEAGGNCL